jgi:glycosyltransferase involved in cell wall biosynthesis
LIVNPYLRKGVFFLLEAFRSVHDAVPGCKLVIAGDAPELKAIRQVVATMRDPSSVVIMGHVERTKLPSVIRDCTVFCIPSFGEPFGQVTLEAMSCGRAIVGTDAGGLAHLITEKGGRKVPVAQVKPLAHSLIEILETPGLAQAMGEHNRALAESVYAWPRVMERLEGAYYSAITPAEPSQLVCMTGERGQAADEAAEPAARIGVF